MAREQKIETDVFGGMSAEEPKLSLTASELQAMIAEQVAKALVVAAPAASGIGDAKALFEQMALSIAEMSHQTNRTHKPVDPKVLAARKIGAEKLEAALAAVHAARKQAADQIYGSEEERQAAIKSVTPKYRLISAVHLNESFIVPFERNPATKKSDPVELHWANEPNDAMVPINDIAKAVHAAFRESRGQRSDVEKRSVKPAWMTENGLYVEGGIAPRRRDLETTPVLRDLEVSTGVAGPDAEFISVLGKTHAPFSVNYQGKT